MTVQRVPTRSAIRDMMMPPAPEPSHASALASAWNGARPVHLVGNVLERYRSDPGGTERHPEDRERDRGDDPRGLGLDGT